MQSTEFLKMKPEKFIEVISEFAMKDYHEHGILPSLTIAQAILESGWGKSELAQKANNLFGIKASNWTGRTYSKQTGEEVNGKNITITAAFRAYDSVEDNIFDHGVFLNKPRYAKVVAASNYRVACDEILKAGYATNSTYTTKLINLIEKYNLNRFDEIVKQPRPVEQPKPVKKIVFRKKLWEEYMNIIWGGVNPFLSLSWVDDVDGEEVEMKNDRWGYTIKGNHGVLKEWCEEI